MDRRTLTMNWDGLEDDDDSFFDSYDRISSALSLDLASSGSDDDNEEFDDSRMSFASAISSAPVDALRSCKVASNSSPMFENYDMWMAEPGSIQDRRKRLLQGMGLTSNKDIRKMNTTKLNNDVSKEINIPTPAVDSSPSEESKRKQEPDPGPEPEPETPIMLLRSRSDGDVEWFSYSTKKRKEELLGAESKHRLTRTSSVLLTQNVGICQYANPIRVSPKRGRKKSSIENSGELASVANGQFGSFFLIKNLDTGNEFIVKEFNQEGLWNKLNDLQTGKQLTMEEFEKSVGYSPMVRELLRRQNVSTNSDDSRKVNPNTYSYLSKSFRYSKRRGVALLKNIKVVANTMSGLIADKEREQLVDQQPSKNSPSQWVKVRQNGKTCKEFTALHLCQEIQAHEGPIWTIKFSLDSRYLASAGEDRVIHVWEVQECDVMTMKPPDEFNSASSTSLHPMSSSSASDRPPLAEIAPMPSERKKWGKASNRKKGNSVPDYVQVPESVFGLSEKPVCSFKGHLDDVLDLSWSRSQLLLSSSMDKTVRLWDMETQRCLKLFAHNDYVTCIQFNPVDDDYFISGSLDAKVRIWNIPDRQVVDWIDLHEMVTAACYTPDGQGAIVGSHKGNCRTYNITDCKLEQNDHYEIQNKKKSQSKKITGFQFAPWNQSEVLVTSADSRIRILGGSDIIHKFRGLRNTSSQISASFSPDGKYVISASEDSQVYIWKPEEHKNVGTGKTKGSITTYAHEHFQCRDVSVAIPWPGSMKNEPPIVEVHSKRHSKRSIAQPHSASSSPTREDNLASGNSKRQLPPLPKKTTMLERASSCQNEDVTQVSLSRTESGAGIGESFNSASGSIRYGGDSPSITSPGSLPSQSWSSSWSWFDGGSHGGQTVQATAWGLVIVTAGLGGEIRAFQNFGLPLKAGRQTNLFRDLT